VDLDEDLIVFDDGLFHFLEAEDIRRAVLAVYEGLQRFLLAHLKS
jgi:hypothetical protein